MEYQVPTSTESQRFEDHLNEAENIRILFSAPFGAGKSFFLEEYFKSNKEYLTITLQPTDYSVATNTDVFELIKYDILSQIFDKFSKWLEFDESDFCNFLLAQTFVMNKLDLYSLAKSAMKVFVPQAESAEAVVEKVEKLISDFPEYKKEMLSTDEESIIKYLVSIRMQKGSPREQDFFTSKIREYLTRIKTAAKTEIVLIIDDIDRLDADQVFRIFNVFTAHHDSRSETNKFSFDKVIFVCDVNTVEHLFFHKYGTKAEFNGYIDKFYSEAIFFFNNLKFLKESIKTLVSPKECLEKYYPEKAAPKEFFNTYSISKSNFYNVFESLVSKLIDNHIIKIRNFVKFKEYSLPFVNIEHKDERDVPGDRYSAIVLFHLLGQFFARPIDLENALKNLTEGFQGDYTIKKQKYRSSRGIEDLIIEYSLPFINTEEPNGDTHVEQKVSFVTENQTEIAVIYKYNHSLLNDGLNYIKCLKSEIFSMNENGTFSGSIINLPNPYWFLYSAYMECKKMKIKLRLINL